MAVSGWTMLTPQCDAGKITDVDRLPEIGFRKLWSKNSFFDIRLRQARNFRLQGNWIEGAPKSQRIAEREKRHVYASEPRHTREKRRGQSLWWKSLTAQPTQKMVNHPSVVVVHQQWLCFTRKIPRKTLSLAQGDRATVVVLGENEHRVIAAIMDEVLLD